MNLKPFESVARLFLYLGVFTSGFNALRVAENLAVTDVFLLSGFFVTACVTVAKGKMRSLPGWLLLGAAILFLPISASSFFIDDLAASLSAGIKLLIAIFLLPVLITLSVNGEERRLVAVTQAFALGAVVSAVAATLQAIDILPKSVAQQQLIFDGRYSAFSAHPNHLGFYCALAAPFVVIAYQFVSLRTARILILIILFILAIGILLSGSRAAIIVAVLGTLACGYFLLPSSREKLRYVIFFLMLAVLGVAALQGGVLLDFVGDSTWFVGISRLLGGEENVYYSDLHRSAFAQEASQQWAANPFLGQGFAEVRVAHNIYLQIISAGGMLAAIGFFGILIAATATGLVRFTRRRGSSIVRSIILASSIGVGMYLVWGLAQNGIFDRYIFVPLALIVASDTVVRRKTDARLLAKHSEYSLRITNR